MFTGNPEYNVTDQGRSKVTVAATDPTVNDDVTEGYRQLRSKWYNTANGKTYLLLDHTDGAAVWEQTNLEPGDLSTVAVSGDYNDLSNLPALAAVATSGDYNDLSNTPALATVATSGDYNDLSGTPALAAVATSGLIKDLTDLSALAQNPGSGQDGFALTWDDGNSKYTLQELVAILNVESTSNANSIYYYEPVTGNHRQNVFVIPSSADTGSIAQAETILYFAQDEDDTIDANTEVYSSSSGFLQGNGIVALNQDDRTYMQFHLAQGFDNLTDSEMVMRLIHDSTDSRMDLRGNRIIGVGALYVQERSEANSDISGSGQLYVKNETPCQLWFANDDGDEILAAPISGTFTPGLEDNSGNAASIGTATGRYMRVGDRVYVEVILSGVDTTGLTGTDLLRITNLPFTSRAGTSGAATGPVRANNVTFSGNSLIVKPVSNTTYLRLISSISGANGSTVKVSGLTSGSADIYFSLWYEIE